MVKIYLAGAIRDFHEEDIQWRETLIRRIQAKYALDVRILNPLGNKTFNPETKQWLMGGITATAHDIVAQDLWCVQEADIIISNVTSLADGYPSIGTIMEMGAAAGNQKRKLIYTIMEPKSAGSVGNANPGVFRIHPFLSEVSSSIFPSVEACWAFLDTHLAMLTGLNPSFGGTVSGK